MLKIDNLTVRYGAAITAVKEMNVAVGEGQLVAILGQNGAGKSTLLKALVAQAPVISGIISYQGKQVNARRGLSVTNGVSYVPEDRGVFAALSVKENFLLALSGAKKRVSTHSDDELIEEQLERFPGLKKHLNRGASFLSGGEQQQLAIARALLAKPDLLLLDEPTLGLAPIIVDQIFSVIADLRREGLTILLVEQNVIRSLELADYSYIVQAPGHVVGEGTIQQLDQNEHVRDYLGIDLSAIESSAS